MFEKNLRLAFLLDFYGDVLDEHTRSVMKAYYDDDLSLAEVAAIAGISRQGVRHVIKKGEEQLLFLEERLGLAERNESIVKELQGLKRLYTSLLGERDESVRSFGLELEKIVKAIEDKI